MTWDELLALYRSLGGTAENVRLAQGTRGRGVFPIDPSRPATLNTPESLFVPVHDIVIEDRVMRVNAGSPISPAAREFFDLYQLHFGWTACGYDDTWSMQSAWHALDPNVVAAIRAIAKPGSNFPLWRFDPPSVPICSEAYVNERHFAVRGAQHIVPVIDLVNHSGAGRSYYMGDGVGVSGTFPGEMLVRYNGGDSWAHLLNYGFAGPSPLACSLAITVTLPDGRRLSFERSVAHAIADDRMNIPQAQENGQLTTFPFVVLGFAQAPDLPRTVFRTIAAPYMPQADADRLFQSLLQFNRARFTELLQTIRVYDGSMVRTMEKAVLFQLEAAGVSAS